MSNFMTVNILEVLNVRIVHEPHMYRPRDNLAPFLVLAHGFGTDQSAWQKILPSFESDYRVILYDLACAGTVNPNYFYFNSERYETLDGYVDDLLTILDALEVKQCVYVGHSVSSMIGILAAIRRRKQQLFTKLILIGASPCFKKDKDFPDGFEDAEVEEIFKAMETNYKNWTVQYAPLVVGGDLPEAIQEFSRTLFNMSPDISLFVCKHFFKCDLRGVLGLCQVPCYIIQSARDRSVPKSAANYLKNHLGGRSVIRILDIEGHLPHLSSPALLAPELRRGLTRRWDVASAS